MNKTAFVFVMFVAAASAISLSRKVDTLSEATGVVNFRRCGGLGTPLQLRISDCVGNCSFEPGKIYNCEADFMPSSAAPSLTLRVEICMTSGLCMQIINAELPGSSVQPGMIYTARYSLVPNDILSGQTVEFRGQIVHTNNQIVEICLAADVIILIPVG
ncbi:uncharacterized protein LOC110863291 [Folsomia candida]|uniref:Uncharacterized protein n=1 Tax=Folsomia candida TaxID=158441 RepID=A0A226F4E0_FOLCA|nr:uncharacterized protein LOC110863291 [Folsomia candida]OXA64294.1 hypothetical protein Fcan01_01988 [Folsomia candida]